MKAFHYLELLSRAAPYNEFLRTGNLSVGIYRLPVGALDNQKPHGEEEIYYVVTGLARFRFGDKDIAITAGDILFVPAREPHQFYAIEQDLELLVFFAPPEGSR